MKQENREDAVASYAAKLKFATISAQKVRLFANLIRGKYADEGMEMLQCYPNRGARLLEKVLKSAMHNAEDRNASDPENLRIVEVRVDEGPMMRRWMPGSRGVSTVIRKKMSHIIVVLG